MNMVYDETEKFTEAPSLENYLTSPKKEGLEE